MKQKFAILATAIALAIVTVIGLTGDRPEEAEAYPYLSVAAAMSGLVGSSDSPDNDIAIYAAAHSGTGWGRWASYWKSPDQVVYLRFVTNGGTTGCGKSWRLSDTWVSDAVYVSWSGSFCDVYRNRFIPL